MYLPTIELTDDIRSALQGDALWLQRGQWVSWNGVKGRFIANENGQIKILWRFKKEAFSAYTLRFKRACMIAGVKKVSRPARSPLAATANLSPELSQWDAFFNVKFRGIPRSLGRDGFWKTFRAYDVLLSFNNAVIIREFATGKRSIVSRETLGSKLFPPSAISGPYFNRDYPLHGGASCH